MANFINTFKQGKLGKNFGLTTGIKALDKAINGIQRKVIIGLAAAPKVGKTTLCDFSFVISPYLQCLALGILDKIEWIYFSYEVDRVSKEFKFAAFFMAYDYKVYHVSYKGQVYGMCKEYLMGKLLHVNNDGTEEIVPISSEHEEMLKKIYFDRIIPLFGEYAADGTKIKDGKIIFIEDPENPTGLYKYILHYARLHGKFSEETYTTIDEHNNKIVKSRINGYHANDPEKYTFIITDHIRKLRAERGFTLKQTIDKWLEYQVWLRNLCEFTFIDIIHNNRQLSNIDRLRYAGEFIFPTGDDSKDSGNPAEECNIFLTMFNPNDEKYGLKRHFRVDLKDYPDYRSIHLTDSRDTDCPQHIQTRMLGGVNMFLPLFPNY